MVKNINKESRNREVLSAVIDNYIRKAQAVSSEDVCRSFDCPRQPYAM